MPFKPGQSGNPSGRPIMPEELKTKIREAVPGVIDFWIKTYANLEESFPNRNKAAENLIAYGYGKAKEIIDLDLSGHVDGMTIEIVKKIESDSPSLP
jgi:hypothetical protein